MERLKLEAEIANARIAEVELISKLDGLEEQLIKIEVLTDADDHKRKRYELYEARDNLEDHRTRMEQLSTKHAMLINPPKVQLQVQLPGNNYTQKQEVDYTDNIFESLYTNNNNDDGRANYINVMGNDNTHRPRGNYSLARSIKPHRYRKGDDICTFLERFEHFIIVNRITDNNLDLHLLSLVEDDVMYKKLRSVRLTDVQKSKVKLLVAAIKESLYPATETRILRSTMTTLKQEPGENVEIYSQRISDAADKAYSDPTLKEEASLSALISGIREVNIRKKLLEDDVDSFEKATRLAVKCERISKALNDRESFDESHDIEVPVFRVEQERNQTPAGTRTVNSCSKCGKSNHTEETCWRDVTCQLCSTKGHVASVCRASAPGSGNNTRTRRDDDVQGDRFSNSSQVICYGCGQRGHYRSHCTARTQGSTSRGGQRSTYRRAPSFNQRAEQRDYLNGSAAGRYPTESSRRQNQ